MSLTVRAVGQASKRGIIPRLPTGERMIDDVASWLRAEVADAIRLRRTGAPASGAAGLSVGLHPAAPDVVFSAEDSGRVTAAAATSSTGPGYHTFVCSLLHRLGTDLSIAWAGTAAEDPSVDDTGYFASGERRAAERGHLARLRTVLVGARDARRRGAAGLHLDIPWGTRFAFDGALATVLGPRDDAWLERAVEDPRVAIDVWPWVADAMDAHYLLNRALCLMWTEVRWRPLVADGERETVDEVLTLLRRAYSLDPSGSYPWREWSELLALRGASDPRADEIRARAGANGTEGADGADGAPSIGYRRGPVTVVHEGWALEVPGTFAERRTGDEWWGGIGGRSITLAAVETGTAEGPMRPEAILALAGPEFGEGALHHREGAVVGTARLYTEASSGVAFGVLEGYSAVVGSGAAIQVEFGDPEDWRWALERWRALRPA